MTPLSREQTIEQLLKTVDTQHVQRFSQKGDIRALAYDLTPVAKLFLQVLEAAQAKGLKVGFYTFHDRGFTTAKGTYSGAGNGDCDWGLQMWEAANKDGELVFDHMSPNGQSFSIGKTLNCNLGKALIQAAKFLGVVA